MYNFLPHRFCGLLAAVFVVFAASAVQADELSDRIADVRTLAERDLDAAATEMDSIYRSSRLSSSERVRVRLAWAEIRADLAAAEVAKLGPDDEGGLSVRHRWLRALHEAVALVGDGEQIERIDRFFKAYESVAWDIEGTGYGYDAYLLAGELELLRGQEEKALHWFKSAFSLTQQEAGTTAPLFEIPARALLASIPLEQERAEGFEKRKERRKLLITCRDRIREFKEACEGLSDTPWKARLDVLEARVLLQLEQAGPAVALLNAARAAGGEAAREARAVLLELDPEAPQLELRLEVAQDLIDRGQYGEALDAFDRITFLDLDDSALGRVHYEAARCLRALHRYDEAVSRYGKAEALLTGKEAADAAYERILAAQALAQSSSEDPDLSDERYLDSLQAFAADHPEDPRAADVFFIQAKREMAAEDFGAAAENFSRVAPESERFEAAMYQAGYCRYRMAMAAVRKAGEDTVAKRDATVQLENALEALDHYLLVVEREESGHPDPLRTARQPVARFYAAKCDENLARLRVEIAEAAGEHAPDQLLEVSTSHERVLQRLEHFYRRYRTEYDLMPLVLDTQIRSHLALADLRPENCLAHLDQAAGLMDLMVAEYPDDAGIEQRCLYAVGDRMRREGERLGEDGVALQVRGVEYLFAWLKRNELASAGTFDAIGTWSLEIAEATGDAKWYDRALNLLLRIEARFARAELWGQFGHAGMTRAEYEVQEELPRLDRELVARRLAFCFVQMAEYERAAEIYRLRILPLNEDSGVDVEDYSVCLEKWGDQLLLLRRTREAIRKFQEAEKLVGQLILRVKPTEHPEVHWNAQLRYIDLLAKQGEYERAHGYIVNRLEFGHRAEDVEIKVPGVWAEIQQRKQSLQKKIR